MVKPNTTINDIKAKVRLLEGKEVIIKMKESRGKVETINGILRKTFISFFHIDRNTTSYGTLSNSFTYSDILTGEISIQSAEDPTFIIENCPSFVEEEEELELELEDEDEDLEEEADDEDLDIEKIKEEYLGKAI